MALKMVLFLLAFLGASVGALFVPVLGVLGYIMHYSIGPEGQWWNAPLRPIGLRYSLTLAACTAIGIALHYKRLRWRKPLLLAQEKLMLLFLGVVWLTVLISEPTEGAYTIVDHPSVKMTKVLIFVLMMTHLVTRPRDLDWVLWAFVAGALILGLQAYATPRVAFASGRLETVGGPDFRDSNALAAYLAAMLPLIGVQFLRSGWKGKLFCLVAGVFASNAIILARSRGAIVGLAAGAVAAIFLTPRRSRAKIAAGLIVIALGGLYLSDPGFWGRASTMRTTPEEMDTSARSRVEIWEGGMRMLAANPQGVGAGNFQQEIGRYAPKHPNRDAHSTYLRCAAELGLVGIGLLLALLANAVVRLGRVVRQSADLLVPEGTRLAYASYGLLLSLIVFAVTGIFGSLIYVEGFWWMLAMPVCVVRVYDSIWEDLRTLEAEVAIPPGQRARRPTTAARASTVGGAANAV